MRRFNYYLFCITLFFAVLTLSTVTTFVWNDQYWSNGVGSMLACVDAGEGLTGFGGFTTYRFWDGTSLSFAHTSFESPEAAKQCFSSQLPTASSIIEREVLFDEAHENVVGERVVAMFPPDKYSKGEFAVVLAQDGSNIYEISSNSLKRTLTFENKSRKY